MKYVIQKYKQRILQGDGIVRAHYDVIEGDVIIVLYDLLKFETGEYNKLCVFMLRSNLFQNDITEFSEVRKPEAEPQGNSQYLVSLPLVYFKSPVKVEEETQESNLSELLKIWGQQMKSQVHRKELILSEFTITKNK